MHGGSDWQAKRDYSRIIIGDKQQFRDSHWYDQQCRESLKGSLQTAAETNEIGQRAAEQLNQQTEQIQGIQRDVDDISHNLDSSQYLIKGMKSWWGSVVQMFTSPPTVTSKALQSTPPQRLSVVNSQGSYTATSNNLLLSPKQTQPVSEMDRDLDTLSGMLSEMHARAVEIGNTIGQQNTMLNNVQTGVENNSYRMGRQKKDIDKLLKR